MFQLDDKIERTLLAYMNFKVKSVVVLSEKGKNDERQELIYQKTYRSKKYTDTNDGRSLYLSTKDFVSFSNFTYNEDTKEFIKDEIYLTYPSLFELKEYLKIFYEELKSELYTPELDEEGHLLKYKIDYKIAEELTAYIECVNSTMIIQPCLYDDFPGLRIYINTEDRIVTLPQKQTFHLIELITTLNLQTEGCNLLLTSMLYNKFFTNKLPPRTV